MKSIMKSNERQICIGPINIHKFKFSRVCLYHTFQTDNCFYAKKAEF